MNFVSNSPKDTQKVASNLAKKILMNSPLRSGRARVIGLEGELGAGKTVFVKGFSKALKIKGPISSPTFIIMKSYKIPNHIQNYTFHTIYHIDVYRLKDEKDLVKLGIKKIINNFHNIVLIEWAERVRKILPKDHIKIHIDHIGKNKRKIAIR